MPHRHVISVVDIAVHGMPARAQFDPRRLESVVAFAPRGVVIHFVSYGAAAFARMKSSAFLVNVSRGRVVDEPALIQALQGRIAGAALDCFWDEPLAADSPLWTCANVLGMPHTAGETRHYEDNVIDLLLENLDRLWRGERELKNQVV